MAQLDWSDLIIEDISPDQFRAWLSPWLPMIGGRVAPAFMTKFGIWFLRRPEGHVEMLDVLSGEISMVNTNYEDFVGEVNQQWWQETFLFSQLVLQLHEAEKIAGPGQCFALAPHPAMGGPNPMNGDSIDIQYVTVMDVEVWQSLCAQSLGLTS